MIPLWNCVPKQRSNEIDLVQKIGLKDRYTINLNCLIMFTVINIGAKILILKLLSKEKTDLIKTFWRKY